jgi:hypothetical protein
MPSDVGVEIVLQGGLGSHRRWGAIQEELVTQLSTLWTAQRLRDREPGLGKKPRTPGSWRRPCLLPQAGLGCFGWLPPCLPDCDVVGGSVVSLP